MNILWLNCDKMACGTYRCYLPALALQEGGLATSEFLSHDFCPTSAAHGYPDLEGVDVVVFQRPGRAAMGAWMQECVRRGVPTLVELDDDLFNIPRHNAAHTFWEFKETKRNFQYILTETDHVIVSTRPLAQAVEEKMGWASGQHTTVCYNHLHPAVWGEEALKLVGPYQTSGAVVIGWQGSRTHDTDFKEVLPALAQILKERPEVLIRFFGCIPSSVRGVIPEDRFQWSKGVEFTVYPVTMRYLNFDIGIAPVTDSRFNRAKSNLKWLEYSALKIPCVASKVYPYGRSIQHGKTGFLAERQEEWYQALSALVESPELRAEMGQTAYQQVWEKWGHRQHVGSWASAFSKAVGDFKWRTHHLPFFPTSLVSPPTVEETPSR
jgi:glycosyltransferase involved in cell wall biosynthesis